MLRTKLALRFSPPPVPATSRVNEPVGVFLGRVTVRAEAKFGVPDVTVKIPFEADGNPDTESVTCDLKSFRPTTFIWYVIVSPGVVVCDGGVASIRKSGDCAIVTTKVVVCDVVPAVPVIVNTYFPAAADAAAAIESTELNVGVPEFGFSDAVTPLGAPVTFKATLWEVPDTRSVVIVVFAVAPGVIACCAGEAEMEKSNGCTACTVRRPFA
jgi:hypothetical protein